MGRQVVTLIFVAILAIGTLANLIYMPTYIPVYKSYLKVILPTYEVLNIEREKYEQWAKEVVFNELVPEYVEQAKTLWNYDRDELDPYYYFRFREEKTLALWSTFSDNLELEIQYLESELHFTRIFVSMRESTTTPKYLVKFYNLDYPPDLLKVTCQAIAEQVYTWTEPHLSYFKLALPIRKYSCTDCHAVPGKMQVQINEVWNGGILVEVAQRVDEGYLAYDGVSFFIKMMANALAELHRVTSSHLRLVPGLEYISNHQVGIHTHWNDKKIVSTLRKIEDSWAGRISIKIDKFVKNTNALLVPQPSYSLIHGSPETASVIIPSNIGTHHFVRLLDPYTMGQYLFTEVQETENGAKLLRNAIVGGAPELDYYVAVLDIKATLLAVNFYEEEINDFLNLFKQHYCYGYHYYLREFQTDPLLISCEFPSKEFSEYAEWIAKLVLSANDPNRFIRFFPGYFVTNAV